MRCHRHHNDDVGEALARITQLLEQIVTDQEHIEAIAAGIQAAAAEVKTIVDTLRAVEPAVPVDFTSLEAAQAAVAALATPPA